MAETSADAVVVGSALAGLVAAAILTRHGKRVVVLEHADTVGGRGGSVPTADGYWIDFGNRDGHDVGDCQFPWQHGVDAAREAGVTVALRRVERPLRVHRIPDGTVVDAGNWSGEGFLATARISSNVRPTASPSWPRRWDVCAAHRRRRSRRRSRRPSAAGAPPTSRIPASAARCFSSRR